MIRHSRSGSEPKKTKVTGTTRYSRMTLLKQNPKLLDRFLRVIIKKQQEAGLNPISISFVELPFSEYAELVIQVIEAWKS